MKLLYPDKDIPRKTIILLVTPFVLGLIAVNYLKVFRSYADHRIEYLLLEAFMEYISIFLTMNGLVRLFFKTRKVENESKNFGFEKVLPKLEWFRNIIIVFFILCLVWFTVTTMMVLDMAPGWIWNIIWVSLSVMIYWLGHVGIYKYGIMEERKKIRSHIPDRSSIIDVSDKNKSEHLIQFENLLIDKKYFLDPELTLDKVAEELNISKSHLSRLINKELNTSFPDYINQLRIKEAQYYLKHPDFSNYTLVAIGLEAGFASKTTFNNTFKKVTGMTPSEYRNSNETVLETTVES
ncbi:MAG: helix-turn-helix transcriptional regulator [Flavobacterium sp.]